MVLEEALGDPGRPAAGPAAEGADVHEQGKQEARAMQHAAAVAVMMPLLVPVRSRVLMEGLAAVARTPERIQAVGAASVDSALSYKELLLPRPEAACCNIFRLLGPTTR